METATTMEMEMEATTIQEVRKIPMKPFDRYKTLHIPRIYISHISTYKPYFGELTRIQCVKSFISDIIKERFGIPLRIDIVRYRDYRIDVDYYKAYCNIEWYETEELHMVQHCMNYLRPFPRVHLTNDIKDNKYWMLANVETELTDNDARLHNMIHDIENEINYLSQNGIETAAHYFEIKRLKNKCNEIMEETEIKPKLRYPIQKPLQIK